MSDADTILHATCVAIAGRGVLITGPSGSGKSSLALQLMSMGAELIADDRTCLRRDGDLVIATSPPAIAGMIEARGIGILTVPYAAATNLVLVVDVAQVEDARLPERHVASVLDIALPCLHKVDAPYFPAAVHAYLTGIGKESS